MGWKDRMAYLWSQLNRRRAQQELEEEMRLHLELETEAEIASGLTPDQARRRARMRFGGVERYLEESSEASGFQLVDGLWRDLCYGSRRLVRAPVFSLVSSLTLALGIGGTAAVFALVYAVLIRPLPYAEPAELVFISSENETRGWDGFPLPTGAYEAFKREGRTLQGMAAYSEKRLTLLSGDAPDRLRALLVTPDFFEVLGATPLLGSVTSANEAPSVVVSFGLWQRLFGSSRQAIGQSLRLDGKEYAISAVMPREFWFPDAGCEIWLPTRLPAENPWRSWSLRGIARLATGNEIDSAQQEIDSITAGFAEHLPFGGGWRFRVNSWEDETVGEVRASLLFLLGAVGLVLAVCCLNLANLYLGRTRDRSAELAVRTALGAGRGILIRQLIAEHLLLSATGGLLGVLLAFLGVRIILYLAPGDLPRLNEVSPGFAMLAFAFSVSILSGLAAAILPVVRSARIDPGDALRQWRQALADTRQGSRSRSVLVAAQVALATLLVVCAGLMAGSFVHALRVDSGVRSDNVLTVRVELSADRYSTPQQQLDFFQGLDGELSRLPGVEAVGFTTGLPTRGVQMIDSNIRVEGQSEAVPIDVGIDAVTSGYFRALGIPLLSGRLFDDTDRRDGALVTIVNESIARRFFEGDAVGRKILSSDDETWMTIVGVVGDVKQYGLDKETPLLRYVPWSQEPHARAHLVVRSTGESPVTVESLRQVVNRLDPLQPVTDGATLESLLSRSLAPRRLSAWLLSIFSGLALGLALIGLYGVLSYSVSRRRHEIGIRVACGAERRQVFGRFLLHGLKLSVIGLVIGLAAATYVTRFLEGQLFGLTTSDPFSFLLGAVLILLVTLAACFFPARRACRVDPVEALRYE